MITAFAAFALIGAATAAPVSRVDVGAMLKSGAGAASMGKHAAAAAADKESGAAGAGLDGKGAVFGIAGPGAAGAGAFHSPAL